MEEFNMLRALLAIVVTLLLIWNPEKFIQPINNIYRKLAHIITPLPPKDAMFQFRPQTAFITRIAAVMVLLLSLAGFYLNAVHYIEKQ